MKLPEVLDAIRSYGSASTKNTLMKHGAKEPVFGARVADLKVLQKKIKKDQQLALALFDSGVYDARYLAALIANGAEMTEAQLQHWAVTSNSHGISEYSVPWVTSEHPKGWELALKWIESDSELVASSGWSTLAGIVSMKADEELDIPALKKLLKRVEKEIHTAPNRVRYVMNGFVIGVGTYVNALHDLAVETARKVGTVYVDMNGTACKVPGAEDYIAASRNRPGGAKKKKTIKC